MASLLCLASVSQLLKSIVISSELPSHFSSKGAEQFPETKGISKFTVPHFFRGESAVHSSVERM